MTKDAVRAYAVAFMPRYALLRRTLALPDERQHLSDPLGMGHSPLKSALLCAVRPADAGSGSDRRNRGWDSGRDC